MSKDEFLAQINFLNSSNDVFQGSLNTFKTNLNSELDNIRSVASNSVMSSLTSKLDSNSQRLISGYQTCFTWLSNYLEQLNSLENSLANFSYNSLDAPSIFQGSFGNLFDNKVIPILKGDADKNSNLALGELGERVTEKTQKILDAAYNTGSPGGGLCAMWVSMVHDGAGLGYPGGNANDMYWNWCTSSDRSEIQPGMIIAVPSHSHTTAGSTYGHVGIYMGNGMVRDNIGYIRDISLDEWIDYYDTSYTPKWGFIS